MITEFMLPFLLTIGAVSIVALALGARFEPGSDLTVTGESGSDGSDGGDGGGGD